MIRLLLLLLLTLLTAPSFDPMAVLGRQDFPVVPSVRHPNVSAGFTEPSAGTISGQASWFASPAHVSAAGPALRAALGPSWRGQSVTVCGNGRCAVTQLGDWCACPTAVVDLDAPVFARLAPLSTGLLEVRIYPGAMPVPPPTDTLP